MKFGKINAYINTEYSEKLNLRGYPSIILFQGNMEKRIIYNTDISYYDFKNFIDL